MTDPRIEAAKFEPLSSKKSGWSLRLNLRLCLLSTLLIGAAGCVWFMLTTRAVYIETEPPAANIDISGLLQLQLGKRYLIRPGTYDLTLTAAGYQPLQETLVVTDAAAQHYVYRLEQLPGHLHIDTGAVTGATVFVDNVARGETPLLLSDLAPGEYLVEIRAERYLPLREQVALEGAGREQTFSAALKPAWAPLRLASTPPQAQVFSGADLLGTTPLTVELLEGRHELTVRANGYKAWQDTIAVVAGEPQELTDIRLEAADATLFLVSDPARANATLNGNFLGLTPLEVPLTPGETAQVRLFKQGYQPASMSVQARSGEQKRVSVNLQPEWVRVAVKIKPADAAVYVDGALAAVTDGALRLSTRAHNIEVRKPGYVDYKTALTPCPVWNSS